MKTWVVFLPSLATGVLGGVWLWFRPLSFEAETGPGLWLLSGLALGLSLLGAAALLERASASFRYASSLLERVLASLELSPLPVLGFAALTAIAEELFFRGALLSLLGVWAQALLFGLLHPVPLRGWSYMVFSAAAGLAFGYLTLSTGSLWPAIFAHFLVNAWGLGQVWYRQRRLRAVGGYEPRV